MNREALWADGSTWGNGLITGETGMIRIRLITARQALEIYLKTNGRMELTAGGAHRSVVNVIQPLTGKTYKRSTKGKRDALADCTTLLAQIDGQAIVYDPTDS